MCDPRESLDSERANVLKAGVRIRAENRRLDEIAYVEQIPPVSFPKLHGEKSPRPETYAQEKQKLLSYITAHIVRRNWCVCGGARGFFLQLCFSRQIFSKGYHLDACLEGYILFLPCCLNPFLTKYWLCFFPHEESR